MGEINDNSVISKKLIFLDQDFDSQNEILLFISEQAFSIGYIDNIQIYLDAVTKREEEIPTAIGYDIAIPHGKSVAVTHPFIAFLRTKKDLKWSEENEETVRLIFLIGVPIEAEGTLHLKFISELSKKLLDDDFRNKLLSENNVESVYKLLESIEL